MTYISVFREPRDAKKRPKGSCHSPKSDKSSPKPGIKEVYEAPKAAKKEVYEASQLFPKEAEEEEQPGMLFNYLGWVEELLAMLVLLVQYCQCPRQTLEQGGLCSCTVF